MTNVEFFAAEFERLVREDVREGLVLELYLAEEFERLVQADERIAAVAVRVRVNVEAGMREAVRVQRPLTWVAGLPQVWGHDQPRRVERELWQIGG